MSHWTSDTPFTDMENAAWSYLRKQDAYKALGLNEFVEFEGQIMPWDLESRVYPDGSDCPGIGSQLMGITSNRVANLYQDVIRVRFEMCFNTNDFQGVRAPAEKIASTIHGIFFSDKARITKLDPHVLADFDVDEMHLSHGADPDDRRAILFWLFYFTLDLTGKRRSPTGGNNV